MTERFYVSLRLDPAVGWLSEIRDRYGAFRSLVMGADHVARARKRAEELNADPPPATSRAQRRSRSRSS